MKGVYARADAATAAKRIGQLTRMQARGLDQKIADSRELIKKSLAKGTPAILYSGGRDSTALLHLVREQAPDVLILHNDTTLGREESLEFIRKWCADMNYRETTAQDPIAMWRKTGYFPILSKRGHTAYKKRIPGLKTSPVQCCYNLKEKYANKVLQENGTAVVFWGNRASESMRRRMTFIDNGFLFKPKKYQWWQSYPIQHWTQEDVIDYITQNIPEYPHADGSFEGGCRACGTDLTFWPNNLSRLYQQDQGEWKKFMSAGFAEQIMKIKGIEGDPETIINTRPLELLQIHSRRGNHAGQAKKARRSRSSQGKPAG